MSILPHNHSRYKDGCPVVLRSCNCPTCYTARAEGLEEAKKQSPVVWISDPPHYHAYGGPCSVCGDAG